MSAECDKHGCDLYWVDGEYNAPSGCYACDLERAEEHVATLQCELNRVRMKHARLKDELRNKQASNEYQRKARRAKELGEMPPCMQCGARSTVTLVQRVRVYYWCYEHADEHFYARYRAKEVTGGDQ